MFSPSFHAQQAIDCLLLIFHSINIILFFRDFIYARQHTSIKLFSALSVTQQLIIVSELFAIAATIVDMEDALHPLRYSVVGNLKLSTSVGFQISLFLLSVFFSMSAFMNLSLSWAEVAKSSRKLEMTSDRRKLNIYTLILRGTQFVFFVNAVIAITTTKYDILVFATLPIGIIVILSFTIGSKRLVDLLNGSGVGTMPSTHADLANRINTTSHRLVTTLFLYMTFLVGKRLYIIFYVRGIRVDHAESALNRPGIMFDYMQKWAGYFSFLALVIYFNQTLRKRSNTTHHPNETSPPQSNSKVKDSSESKVGPAKINSMAVPASVHTNAN